MRSVIEFINYPNKDGTFTDIKMYLEMDNLVSYTVKSYVPFFGDNAFLSNEIDQVSLNVFINMAIKEINTSSEFKQLSITKDFNQTNS